MAKELISKGIKLSYKTDSSASTYTDLENLVSIPDMGGDTDSVEVTDLSDSAHMYIAGLRSYGDSMDFVFNYAKTQFNTLNALTGEVYWKVTIPDGDSSVTPVVADTVCTFSAEPSVKFNGVTYNEAMQYTLSLKPTSAMIFA